MKKKNIIFLFKKNRNLNPCHFVEIKRNKILSLIISMKFSHTSTSTHAQPLVKNII